MKLKSARRLTYEEQKARVKEFITTFDDFDSNNLDERYGRKKYLIRLVQISPTQQAIADEDVQTFEVEIEDLESFFRKEEESQMVQLFKKNTGRYIDMFTQVADELIPKRTKPINVDDVVVALFRNIVIDLRTF